MQTQLHWRQGGGENQAWAGAIDKRRPEAGNAPLATTSKNISSGQIVNLNGGGGLVGSNLAKLGSYARSNNMSSSLKDSAN